MPGPLEELWWSVLREPSEERRMELAKLAAAGLEEALEEIAKRVGGELVPDTVIALRSIEVVLAALALRRAQGDERPLRLLVPRDPVPGWMPLRMLVEELAARGLVHVYETPVVPRIRPSARDIVERAARILRGFSARIVDITDSPPHLAVSVVRSGAWRLTMLVVLEHMAVFQRVL
ncbi:MAG: hypothetical protein ABWW69_00480 [Pyrodictiaceae archaeon]